MEEVKNTEVKKDEPKKSKLDLKKWKKRALFFANMNKNEAQKEQIIARVLRNK